MHFPIDYPEPGKVGMPQSLKNTEYVYVITGKPAHSTRNFQAIRTSNANQALSINLWRGNVWCEHIETGKRKLIRSVYN